MSNKGQQSLTLEIKMKILNEIDNGKLKKMEIALKYGVAKSTISMIIKNRQQFEAAYKVNKFEPSRKRMRVANYSEIEEALLRWIKEAHSQNLILSGSILQEKAKFFADALGVSDFTCSSGWLQRFKGRHGITYKKMCMEERRVSQEMVNAYLLNRLSLILSNYSESDIFNAYEAGLFWKALPNQTLSLKGTKCSSGKNSKERVTVLVACNISGTEKLPLLVIGKSQKPSCLKTVKMLPVTYEATKKAWITGDIFSKWIKKLDREFHMQGRNICMILDNCSAHCSIPGLKAIKIELLPPNTTARLHPCHQGIIRCVKAYYRRDIIRHAIYSFVKTTDFNINLLDALNLLKSAWREISPETIQNCFRNAGFFQSEPSNLDGFLRMEFGDVTLARAHALFPESVTFSEYVTMDDDVITSGIITDTDIVNEIINFRKNTTRKNACSNSLSDSEEDDVNNIVPLMDAYHAIKTVRHFILQNENSGKFLDSLDKLEDYWKVCASRK